MSEPVSTPPTVLQGDSALVRAIGLSGLVAAMINIIVGAGIFMLPALLSTRMGAGAPLAFVVGAIAIVPIALCFAAVGSRAAATGGPYTYVSAAFGSFAGFIAGALMWICNVASSAGVAAALLTQLANASAVFGEPLPRSATLIVLYALLIALNAFGVKLGARAIFVLAGLKLTPLFLLAGLGLFFVDWGQVSWVEIPSWGALGTSMVLVMFAYSGMETALIPSGEVRDPARQVPRATIAAILLVVLLYIGIQIVCQGVLGPALPRSTAPIAQAAGALWSPGLGLLLVTACVSMAGFLMGNLLASSRLLFVAHGGIACALALVGNFEALALISGGAICLVYIAVSIAAWRAQQLGLRERGALFVLPGGPLVPAIAVLAMVAVVATLTLAEWFAIGAALVAIVLLYLALRHVRQRRLAVTRG